MDRAIAAVATAYGRGGIAVIRISGEDAVLIASRVFIPKSNKSLCDIKANCAVYGDIVSDNSIIDDGIATVYYAPRSFTGEDMVEISCHGGIALTNLVLKSCFDAGAASAAAGEFTKRAVVNGKISLGTAEAIAEVIDAEGERAVKLLSRAKNGELFAKVERAASSLTTLNASILAYIDFPDEDIDELTDENFLNTLTAIEKEIIALKNSYKSYTAIRDGITVAIVGLPNSGKSSVMNRLCEYERSIVTDIEGTTRDIVEERISLNGVIYKLWDTAGLRESADIVEQIGVSKSRDALMKADVILYVASKSTTALADEKELIEEIACKNVIVAINKNDIESENEEFLNILADRFNEPIYLSTITGEGFDTLRDKLAENGEQSDILESAFILNNRQMQLITEAADRIAEAITMVESGLTPDFVSVALDEAINALLVLCGKKATEEVVDEIFRNFCVGK